MNQTIQPSLSNKMPYSLGDKLCLPRKEQTVDLSQKADSFEAQSLKAKSPVKKEAQKQTASYAWLIGGSVVVLGLVGLAIYQREALASSWEKLFKKSATEPPKPPVVPQKPPVSLMTEALQNQLNALPDGLKPDVTAYDLADPNQFDELRLYVEGLHELREKRDTQTLCNAINKICASIGGNNDDCAWISRAQARRLTGTIENGKPIGKDIDLARPVVMDDSLVTSDYNQMDRETRRGEILCGYDPFREKFKLGKHHFFGTNYHGTSSRPEIEKDPYIGRTYNEVEALLKQQENGSLFMLFHTISDGSNPRHASILANINGEIYYVDNFIDGTVASTFEGLFDKKHQLFQSLKKRVE